MTQKRLNNEILMHCHESMPMDLNEVAKTFIGANERHEKYFGSF